MTEDTGSRALLSDPTRRSDGLIARVSVTTQPDPARAAVTADFFTPVLREALRANHRNGKPIHSGTVMLLLDALAASEARLAEVERERDEMAAFVRQVAIPLVVYSDAQCRNAVHAWQDDAHALLLAHPAARSAGEGSE